MYTENIAFIFRVHVIESNEISYTQFPSKIPIQNPTPMHVVDIVLYRYSHIIKSPTLTTVAFVRPISAIVLSVAEKSVVDTISVVTCKLVHSARGFCENKDKTRRSVTEYNDDLG